MTLKSQVFETKIFHKILLVSKFYQDNLERLTQEMAVGQHQPRDFTITGLFTNPAHFHHYVEISRREQVDFSAHNTSLEKIERRWAELGFDARRDALLAQLGPEETQQRLLEEIADLLRRYAGGVESMMTNLREMEAEEYEEYTQDEELYNLETLWLRDSVEILLPLLTETEAKATLEWDLAQADATLRRRGAEMFGPLLRMGSIQQLRDARFEPRDRWWWYLDEIDGD